MPQESDQESSTAGPGATLANQRILFIGGGNMASAMISGLVASGVPAAHIGVIEPVAAARAALQNRHRTNVFPDADGVGEAALFDALVLAVKPQQAGAALLASRALLRRHPEAVLISIAAGINIETLIAMSGGHRRVVRAMPNTPALIGEGIAGLFAPAGSHRDDCALAQAILESTGKVVSVDRENLIDIVTAVSGSGPAYAFYLIEAMTEAGIAGGLDAAAARMLAVHTVKGAAMLAVASDEPLQTLRARVTSPGGTTAAAVAVLDQRQVKASIVLAIQAAAMRSQQLSQQTTSPEGSTDWNPPGQGAPPGSPARP